MDAVLNRVPKGMPKYFMGRLPTLQLRILAKASILPTSPIETFSLFPTFTFKPVKAWKQDKASLIATSWSQEASQNKTVSFAKSSCDMRTQIEFTGPTWKLRSKPLSSVFLRIRDKTSISKRKRRGDKGSPFLNPRDLPKKPTGDPFTRIEKWTVEMQALIPEREAKVTTWERFVIVQSKPISCFKKPLSLKPLSSK